MLVMSTGKKVRVAEFYSGVGGWAYGARRAVEELYGTSVALEVVIAVDVSTTCNDTYLHNFGVKPTQRRLEDVDASLLEGLDGWLLSPPCQPHTRQRDADDPGRDDKDKRSASFLRLCEVLGALEGPPRFVCLENVVGFAGSACCLSWHDALRRAGFCAPVARHLSPTMIGVPHERPRYFEWAGRFAGVVKAKTWTEADAAPEDEWPYMGWQPPVVVPQPVEDYLELPARLDASDAAAAEVEPWLVPAEVLDKDAAWCLDVVDATSVDATACFTKSYGRFARGTGSVLRVKQTYEDADLASLGLGRADPSTRAFGTDWKAKVTLRYFAPKEIANLLGFPRKDFAFPDHVSTKARWAAMGNSLHVDAAAIVVKNAIIDSGGNFWFKYPKHLDDEPDPDIARRIL